MEDAATDAAGPDAGCPSGATAAALSNTEGSASSGARPAITGVAAPPEREIASSTSATSDSAVCADACGAAGGAPVDGGDEAPVPGAR